MKAEVFPVSSGASQDNQLSCIFNESRITLEVPSVVQLPVDIGQVARFARHGDDLELTFKRGVISVIENFFVETADGRSDIVFA